MFSHKHGVTLWVASLVFLSLGIGEIIVGQLIASHVLLVLGVHNIFDGGLLAFNAKAERWEDIPDLNKWRCTMAPLFAIGSSLAILAGAVWTAIASSGHEDLQRPWLALLIGGSDIVLNQTLARRLGHQHHHSGGNRWAARMHLYGDAAVGCIGVVWLLLVACGATNSDNLGGVLSSLFLIGMSCWMIAVSIQNYRQHLPRHDHVHPAADHHHG